MAEYTELVNEYSGRDMKHATDALEACAGILHTISQCLHSSMLYGLLKAFLATALMWRLEVVPSGRGMVDHPSWAWSA